MSKKYIYLLYSILFDSIGLLSFLIPGIGELIDVLWAPLSSFIILKMYKGDFAKVAALLSLVEEAGIMGTDFIPTFTLTWVYNFYIKKDN